MLLLLYTMYMSLNICKLLTTIVHHEVKFSSFHQGHIFSNYVVFFPRTMCLPLYCEHWSKITLGLGVKNTHPCNLFI